MSKQTIVTITGPTCSGKSTLLNYLCRNEFGKPISTTTRSPRVGEAHGREYFFITPEKSIQMELDNEFAEFVVFNGIRYGIPNSEIMQKLNEYEYVAVVVEPIGVKQYKEFAEKYGYRHVSVFINTSKAIRQDRFSTRFLDDIIIPLDNGDDKKAKRIIGDYLHRHQVMVNDEQNWENMYEWDVVVKGDELSVEEMAFQIREELRLGANKEAK